MKEWYKGSKVWYVSFTQEIKMIQEVWDPLKPICSGLLNLKITNTQTCTGIKKIFKLNTFNLSLQLNESEPMLITLTLVGTCWWSRRGTKLYDLNQLNMLPYFIFWKDDHPIVSLSPKFLHSLFTCMEGPRIVLEMFKPRKFLGLKKIYPKHFLGWQIFDPPTYLLPQK